MIDNLDEEKANNIINSINAIKIPNNENELVNKNNPQDNIQMNQDDMTYNKNYTNLNEINIINDENKTNNIESKNPEINTNISSSKTLSSEYKHKKKEQKGMKDLAFKFPLQNALSKVEIPFSFQQNLNSQKNNNRFHSYITIKDTPKLYIDISDDNKMDKFLLSNTIESLKATNQKQENKLQVIDNNIMQYKNENDMLREEIEKLHHEISLSNNNIGHLKTTIEQINLNNDKIISEMNQKIKEKNDMYLNLKKNYEDIEKEIENNKSEENKKEILFKIKEEINTIQKNNYNNLKYYSNKFFKNVIITDEYIHQTLQKDIIDFMVLINEKINVIKPKVNELINLIQNSVEQSIGSEYEVKLYGSHATGLCLPWSDIDVVLCKKNGNLNDNSYSNKYIPLHDLFTYLQKNKDFKSINYIGATTVPLIKIKTKENTGIKNVDISLQDNSHYGIECVSLVTKFIKEYEVLLPMVLALKNILKQANLNDPYTVSSYYFINII